jgi:hypothetical protein
VRLCLVAIQSRFWECMAATGYQHCVTPAKSTTDLLVYDHQLIADRMRELFPQLHDRIPTGQPGIYVSVSGPMNLLDATKSVNSMRMTCEPPSPSRCTGDTDVQICEVARGSGQEGVD